MRFLILTIALIARYTFAAGDVSHFIDYSLLDVDKFSFITLLLLAILIDLLAYFHKANPSIPLKLKIRLQLGMHIIFGINSVYIMISETTTGIYGIIVFVLVFVVNLYLPHKIIHAMHEDDSGGDKSKENTDLTEKTKE